MRYILILTLAFVVSASAYDLNDQLIQSEGDITQNGDFSAISFSTVDGAYNRWVAADYVPDANVSFRGFDAHWTYFDDDVQPGDIDFEFYESDLNTAPFAYASVDNDGITQTNTGWVLPTSGSMVFFNEMNLDSAEFVDMSSGNTYWIAVQNDTVAQAFVVCRDDYPWDMGWWYGDDAYWINTFNMWGFAVDFSMRFRGGIEGAIESASIGEIKASFK